MPVYSTVVEHVGVIVDSNSIPEIILTCLELLNLEVNPIDNSFDLLIYLDL